MEIPKKLKIGGRIYEVILKSEKDGNTNQGSVSNWFLKIWIEESQPKDGQEETLLHEIIEVIKANNNLEMSHQTIATLSNNLFQVLKDNNLLK